MSQQDMDRLREAIADELGLARDGIGHEEAGVADEIVSKYVEPIIARVEASRRDWAAEAARLQHELEELTATFHQRAAERAESVGDGPQCDGDCDNADCHMVSAVTTWQFAAATVQRRLSQADDVNGWSLPLCAVHPEVER